MKRLAAEWEQQKAVLIALPDMNTDWSDYLDDALLFYKSLIEAISFRQQLVIVTNDVEQNKAIAKNAENNNIVWVECPINDTWIRDYGPLSVIENGKLILMDFIFNGWGNKFDAAKDNAVTQMLYKNGIFDREASLCSFDFVLEGGSLESDGEGTLLVTSKCLLNTNRNSDYTKVDIENYLTNILELKQILWLDYGELEGDDTDGHIDTLARLCSPDTIAYVKCYDTADLHFDELNKMEQQLKTFRTISGDKYRLIPLPLPDAKFGSAGNRLPATYANFLIINKAVLLPVYNCKTDIQAIELMKTLFPNREIIPIDATILIEQGGSIHCATMQVNL